MVSSTSEQRWPSVDEVVEAYESAQVRDGAADLQAFLPAADHPQFLTIVCELVRVDLEYGWERGRPRRLEEYESLCPALFRDKARLQEIAFEEYRLRQHAGEDPSPLEYRRRFGAEGLEWPSSLFAPARPETNGKIDSFDESDAAPGAGDGELARAASAYRAYRRSRGGDGAALEAAMASLRVESEHASLFADLHRSDPRAADRLAQAVTSLPEVGSRFLGFHLTAELGRGAFGRVYLARQGDLANRLVALKVSADAAGETHALAQLQHTNVVPIYSVHRNGPFQAVCMPYLGSTTLASVLADLKRQKSLPDSGAGLLSNLRTSQLLHAEARPASSRARAAPESTNNHQPDGPAPSSELALPALDTRVPPQIERLRGLGYVQAVLWLVARVADGLAHAHERGILHRDLKPANILFADDGEPLLLDFNLAADTKLRARATAALIGGTLPYMAPEHLDAFRDGAQPVDARSDLYALGVILYELLTGRHPFTIHRGAVSETLPLMIADRQGPPPEVCRWNRLASPAVESIVRRCLHADPAQRYQTARELQDDLQRQLEDRPLRHAAEPSLRESLAKWSRRHPRLTSSTSVAMVCGLLLVAVAAGFWSRQTHLLRLEAADALRRVSEDRRQADFLLGARDAEPSQLAEGLALCEHALDRFRVLNGPGWTSGPKVAALTPSERERLRGDVGQLLLLWARAEGWQAQATADLARQASLLQHAERLAQLAEGCYGSEAAPRSMWSVRAELARLSGREAEARDLQVRADRVAARSPGDQLWRITEGLDSAHRREVLDLLQGLSQPDLQDPYTWLVLGNTYRRMKQFEEAASCFTMAAGLRPGLYWSFNLRGLLFLERKEYAQAIADFDRVLSLRPDLLEPLHNRALARLGLNDCSGAAADLSQVLQQKEAPTRAFELRALARQRLGDLEGAKRDIAELLRRTPADDLSWVARGLARRQAGDAEGALADFETALKLNPRCKPALQDKAEILSDHLGRNEEALRALDAELALYPGTPEALAGRAVLLARLGRRAAAHRDIQAALAADTTSGTLYRAACTYALTSQQSPGDLRLALDRLAEALRQDSKWLRIMPRDRDLDPIRNQPAFQEIARAMALLWPGNGAEPAGVRKEPR